jgi:hypothetical protein
VGAETVIRFVLSNIQIQNEFGFRRDLLSIDGRASAEVPASVAHRFFHWAQGQGGVVLVPEYLSETARTEHERRSVEGVVMVEACSAHDDCREHPEVGVLCLRKRREKET